MTEPTYRDLGCEMAGPFEKGEETCEGFGPVTTYVQLVGESVERSRDALYAMPDSAVTSRVRAYIGWAFLKMPGALLAQMRRPIVEVGWWRRAGFVLSFAVLQPLLSLFYAVGFRNGWSRDERPGPRHAEAMIRSRCPGAKRPDRSPKAAGVHPFSARPTGKLTKLTTSLSTCARDRPRG